MYFTFAWRYFKAKKSTNAINIIAWVTVSVIAFATCCQVLVLSVFNGLEGLVKSLYSSFYTDLKVTPANGKTFVLTAGQINALQQQHSVENISLIAEEKALLKNRDQQTVIYLSFFKIEDSFAALKKIEERSWEIKKELTARVRHQLRSMPLLTFFIDDTLDYVDKMEKIFKEIKKDNED